MTKLIAEIGINHGGDFRNAVELIKRAKESGVWAVKFQYRSNNFFADNHEMGSTLIKSELERSSLDQNWIPELSMIAHDAGLKIGFSFFRKKDLNDFYKKNYSCDFIKIPSAEFRNIELIKLAKSKKVPIMISYGGGTEAEIEKYIKLAKLDQTDCVFHCIANYPIATGNQQLAFLERIRKITNAKVGYSSHDEYWEIILLALHFEIDFIERHICISKNDLGLDISTSSDHYELKKLNEIITKYDEIMGSPPRIVNQGEILNIRNLGTSLYFDRAYKKNEKVLLSELIEKSPATGLRVNEIGDLKDFVICNDVNSGDPLLKSHINGLDEIKSSIIEFREENKISLPVRLHDFADIKERFRGNYFEMHLSYDEVLQLGSDINLLDSFVTKGNVISIHLPDYINNDDLIDPFSKKKSIRNKSQELIDICIKVSKYVTKLSNEPCLILGSFSKRHSTKDLFYKTFKKYCEDIKKEHDIDLYAQWLPKKAWYFGGTAILDQFCALDDIDLIIKYDIKLCLDFSHLILSANYFQKDWYEWYKLLENQISHIHLSDAEGDDGEGVDFGQGDLSNHNEILELPYIKVLEVWEGHHNIGEKFYSALKFLSNNVK